MPALFRLSLFTQATVRYPEIKQALFIDGLRDKIVQYALEKGDIVI